ncbi:MAG: DUF397 domain-containing protein [Actinomycetota bacterium]|nr:DUF397 domain-containing protein [Actinomycetota bacterium]
MAEQATWRKSSFSAANGECVEVSWHKSSFSGPNGGCVEVSWPEQAVGVRDSKYPTGPTLAFPAAHWHEFLGTSSGPNG